MGVMRKNHITDRYSVMLPGSTGDGTPEPEDEPIISLVNRDGVLQRVHGYRSGDDDSWAIHVFESRNPIVSTDTESSYGDSPRYYHPAYGYHYVLTAAQAAPDMAESEQWFNMLVAVQDRMRWLYDQKKVGYVSVFADVNGGDDKRTPHLQIATFPGVPPVIASEAKAATIIQNERGVCAMCQIISEETNGPRQVIQTDSFLAFCPWSPSYPYEFWIAPKKHSTSFLKTSQRDLGDLALMLQTSLGGMERTLDGIPYSLAFHLSPREEEHPPDTLAHRSISRHKGACQHGQGLWHIAQPHLPGRGRRTHGHRRTKGAGSDNGHRLGDHTTHHGLIRNGCHLDSWRWRSG